MSIPLRLARIQRYLNEEYNIGIAEDGTFGTETLGAVELALGIEEWTIKSRNDVEVQEQFDERTEKNLATLAPLAIPTMRKLVALAMEVAESEGVTIKVISGHRTWEEQDRLYAKGRTAPGTIVTNARGGYSNHNFGIAVDFGVFRGPEYLDVSKKKSDQDIVSKAHGRIAILAKEHSLDTEWGGDWKSLTDYPHHELKTGLTMAEKRKRYLERGSVFA